MIYKADDRYAWLQATPEGLRQLLRRKLSFFFEMNACLDRREVSRPSLLKHASEQGYFSLMAFSSAFCLTANLFAVTNLIWPYNMLFFTASAGLMGGFIGANYAKVQLTAPFTLAQEEALIFDDGFTKYESEENRGFGV